MLRQPIFLVGAERSGTTLLRLMLSHHSDLAWCNEFEYAVDQISETGEFPDLKNYYAWLENHRIFQATQFTIDPSLAYPELINSFLLQKQQKENKTVIGATVHRHFDKLLLMWPEARFIHLIRDGRDVAKSCISMGWAGNVWTGCERWQEAELLWNKLQSKLSNNSYLQITYEALITSPQKILSHICEFIGVKYQNSMLDYPKDTTYSLPDSRFIAQWQQTLSQKEIRLVESRIGDLLKQRNYQLSGLIFKELTPLEIKQLTLQDWWYRVNFRRKKFGNFLFVSDYISRKLRLKRMYQNVKIRINEIENQHLK